MLAVDSPPFRADHVGSLLRPPTRFVPLEQLCLSPQCGFASTLEGNNLTYEEQVAKLGLIVETADEVWGHRP